MISAGNPICSGSSLDFRAYDSVLTSFSIFIIFVTHFIPIFFVNKLQYVAVTVLQDLHKQKI